MIEISREPLRPDVNIGKVRDRTYGATVVFVGSVRAVSNDGKKVVCLDYDLGAEGLARSKLQEIADELKARFDIGKVAISHRLGRLEVGELTSVFAISSVHRQQAFEAAQFALDRFKEVTPLWEKEVTE